MAFTGIPVLGNGPGHAAAAFRIKDRCFQGQPCQDIGAVALQRIRIVIRYKTSGRPLTGQSGNTLKFDEGNHLKWLRVIPPAVVYQQIAQELGQEQEGAYIRLGAAFFAPQSSSMSELFKTHIKKFVDLPDEEFSDLLAFFQVQQVRKKENLLVEGKVCRYHYFVLSGCLRKFFVNEKGVEQTTEFAIENWWITDNTAFEHRRPTEFYIQAVEKSEVLRIDHAAQEELLTAFPKMERYFRFIYQRAYAASQMRIKYLYDLSKEEMFHHFNNHYPEFIRRIPQHLIASFLGFTPEYLSEIRKKTNS